MMKYGSDIFTDWLGRGWGLLLLGYSAPKFAKKIVDLDLWSCASAIQYKSEQGLCDSSWFVV